MPNTPQPARRPRIPLKDITVTAARAAARLADDRVREVAKPITFDSAL